MDLMQIRRGLIASMASGKAFVSGSFTCPDEDTVQTIDFNKTFSSYLFIIEMTEESKTDLVNSGYNGNKAFVFVGVYPKRRIDNKDVSENADNYVGRINPSTKVVSTSSDANITMTGSSISNNVRAVTYSAVNFFFRGYSYNYTIVSLD